VAEGAAAIGQAAERVAAASQGVDGQTARLRGQVDGFLTQMRAT
jgi:hypothetical protein